MKTPSSLISRFAASTAIFAAAIVVLAYLSFHAIRGDIFEDSFESPLEEWSTYIAGRIGEDPEIAKFAARNHQMGVLLTTREGIYAFGPDGEPVTPEFLAENHSNVRTILVHGTWRYRLLVLPERQRCVRLEPVRVVVADRRLVVSRRCRVRRSTVAAATVEVAQGECRKSFCG